MVSTKGLPRWLQRYNEGGACCQIHASVRCVPRGGGERFREITHIFLSMEHVFGGSSMVPGERFLKGKAKATMMFVEETDANGVRLC